MCNIETTASAAMKHRSRKNLGNITYTRWKKGEIIRFHKGLLFLTPNDSMYLLVDGMDSKYNNGSKDVANGEEHAFIR